MLKNTSWDDFFKRHLKTKTGEEKKKDLKNILKAEYLAQLSFTSCGWFFSEFGIQSRQNIIDSYNAIIAASNAIPSLKNTLPRFYSDIAKIEDNVHDIEGNLLHINGFSELSKYVIKEMSKDNIFIPMIKPFKTGKKRIILPSYQSSLQSLPLA
jgi:hypothetical protein